MHQNFALILLRKINEKSFKNRPKLVQHRPKIDTKSHQEPLKSTPEPPRACEEASGGSKTRLGREKARNRLGPQAFPAGSKRKLNSKNYVSV